MNRTTALFGAFLAGLFLVAAAWYSWHAYTTPAIPGISLDGTEPLAAKVAE